MCAFPVPQLSECNKNIDGLKNNTKKGKTLAYKNWSAESTLPLGICLFAFFCVQNCNIDVDE